MSTWLKKIQTEIKTIPAKSVIAPSRVPVKPDERVVGVVTDIDLRKLYTVASRRRNKALRCLAATKKEHARGTHRHCRRNEQLFNTLKNETKLLMEIFWISIQESFKLQSEPSIGIREGWKVVCCPAEDESSMAQIPSALAFLFAASAVAAAKEKPKE